MHTTSRLGLAAALTLALGACGSSDDVSDDASAESVEEIADEAMEPVTEEPVEDSAVLAQPEEDEPELSPVEEKSNTEQSEEAQELADQIKAELAGTQSAGAAEAPAEPAQE